MQDSPFQKGEQMDILKEKIDANSFQTMKHIIFLTSTKNNRERTKGGRRLYLSVSG